jgi:rRNA maturation endonuclease Nob1
MQDRKDWKMENDEKYIKTLIERDTSMSVIKKGLDKEGVYIEKSCPKCKQIIYNYVPNFCGNCGQRLKKL